MEAYLVIDVGSVTTKFAVLDKCKACPNLCEIAQLLLGGEVLARWGGRCDLWERSPSAKNFNRVSK